MIVKHDGGVAAESRSGDGAQNVYVDDRAKSKYISVPGVSWLSKDGWEMRVVEKERWTEIPLCYMLLGSDIALFHLTSTLSLIIRSVLIPVELNNAFFLGNSHPVSDKLPSLTIYKH